MNLAESLRRIPSTRSAWIEETQCGSFEALIAASVHLPTVEGPPRVALRLKAVGSALQAICALDGRVESLVLLSAEENAGTAGALAEASRCAWIISDTDDGPALGAVPVLPWSALPRGPGSPAPEYETRWVLPTSGTSGEPKLVCHSLASLTQSVRSDYSRSADVRWGLLYDHARFAGMQVITQSLLSGATLLVPPADASLGAKVDFLALHRCTHLGGTPSLWRALLMTPSFNTLQIRQVTLGGEIADERLLNALRGRFPNAGVRHIYAATEAGVGFTVTDGRAGFPRSYLDDAGLDVQLRIDDGRLLVRRAGVRTSYFGAPVDIQDADGFVDTGDLVEVSGDRVLFLGRASGVINVGGYKVYPEFVESVLRGHEGVSMARVYARSSPITGSLVASDVVAANGFDDHPELIRSIRRHCTSRLPRHHQPSIVNVVHRIDLTSAGKVARGR